MRSTWHLLAGAAAQLVRLRPMMARAPEPSLRVGVISKDPPILRLMWWQDEDVNRAAMSQVAKIAAGRDCWLLLSAGVTMELDEFLEPTVDQVRATVAEHPNLHPVFLANNEAEHRRLSDAGLETVLCGQNALKDTDVFRVMPEVAKKYDALYDARLSIFKRHHLATEVPRLALVYYGKGDTDPDELAYERRTRDELATATWLNEGPRGKYRRLGPDDMARAINASHAGLALSAVEGAMYASIQYLMCGVPVVTTPSLGGRDEFFDEHNSRTVEESPSAVAAAVAELVADPPDPQEIRRATLERVAEHRARLLAHVEQIQASVGSSERLSQRWDALFHDRLLAKVTTKEASATLDGGRAG